MTVAGIVWTFGCVFALAIFAFVNHGVEDPDHRYSGVEIIWLSVLWPLTILALGAVAIAAKVQGWSR